MMSWRERAPGVATMGVTWGITSREEVVAYHPDFIVDNWGQLLAAVGSLEERREQKQEGGSRG